MWYTLAWRSKHGTANSAPTKLEKTRVSIQASASKAPASKAIAEDPTEAPRTQMSRAADVAYRHIRHAIITGALRSGEKLQEAKLATRIGVSRTPVRQALHRLGGEGLVVLERYRESTVARFTGPDLPQIFRLPA